MRCLACDKRLSEYESTMKTESGAFLDLCFRCYQTIKKDTPARGNPDLLHCGDEEESELDNTESLWYPSDSIENDE
jgi:hypothetical protein